MSPKRKILLFAGIMAVFGVSVSIAIIAIGGGFSGPGPSLFNPPSSADLWGVGQNLHPGTILNYSLTRIGNHSSPWSSLGENSSLINSLVSMNFIQDGGNGDNNKWKVIFHIVNDTKSRTVRQATVLLTKQQLTNAGPINQNFTS